MTKVACQLSITPQGEMWSAISYAAFGWVSTKVGTLFASAKYLSAPIVFCIPLAPAARAKSSALNFNKLLASNGPGENSNCR